MLKGVVIMGTFVRLRFPVLANWLLTFRGPSLGLRFAVFAAMLLALASAACGGNLAAASSGKVGCSPSQISISNDEQGWGTRSWVASCKGRRYFCSATQTGKSSSDVSCSAEGGED